MKQNNILRSSLLAALFAGSVQAGDEIAPLDDGMMVTHLSQQYASEQSAYEEYFTKRQFALTEASDCTISTGATITPDEPLNLDIQSLFINQLNAETGCFSDLTATFDETRDEWALLLRVDALHLSSTAAADVGSRLFSHAGNQLHIAAADAQSPRLNRSMTLDADVQPVNHALVVISSACEGELDCQPEFNMSASGVMASVDLTVEGIYTRTTRSTQPILDSSPDDFLQDSKSSSTGFINGDFENYGTGWTWTKGNHTGFGTPTDCQDLNYPTPSFTLKPRVSQGTSNAWAWHGAEMGTAWNSPPQVRHFDLAQTVTVPENSNFKFRQASWTARENGINYPTRMRVLAVDLTTGQTRVLKQITNSTNTFFKTHTVDVSDMGGHLVKFRFYSCGEVRNTITTTATHGRWFVDDARFEERPINPNALPKAGQWHDPNHSGQGLHISKNGNDDYSLFWYTYTPQGKPVWYMSAAGPMSNGVWDKTLYKVLWNTGSQTTSVQTAGNIRLEMLSNTQLRFKWNLNSIGGSSGFDGTINMEQFHGDGSVTGNWFEPELDGWGISTSYQNSPNGPDTVVLAFMYDGSQPVWTIGTLEGLPQNYNNVSMSYVTSTSHCPGCSGNTPPLYQGAGNAGFHLNFTQGRGYIDVAFPSGNIWKRGRSNNPVIMYRLTGS